MDTASELFMRHGIRRVTVEEICRKAEVSKMTFYKYFANKTDLARRLWQVWLDEDLREFEAINRLDIPFTEKLTRKLEHNIALQSRFSEDLVMDLHELEVDQNEFGRRFMAYILECQVKGDIRAEIRPEFILAVMEKMEELSRDEALRRAYPDIESMTREFWNFFYFGVVPRPDVGEPCESD